MHDPGRLESESSSGPVLGRPLRVWGHSVNAESRQPDCLPLCSPETTFRWKGVRHGSLGTRTPLSWGSSPGLGGCRAPGAEQSLCPGIPGRRSLHRGLRLPKSHLQAAGGC